jgi:histidinol phosphatase-like enzyme
MIGDKQSDIDLAHNAGIGKSIYIGDNKKILNATYMFSSIKECLFDFNIDKV